MAGTMAVLGDSGIGVGVTSLGGKVWADKNKLGLIIATGLALRKKFSIVILLIFLPILFALLLQHGASISAAFLISLAILPMFITELSGKILAIVPLLRQDIYPLQVINIYTAIFRFFCVCAFIFVLPYATIAILTAGLVQVWQNHKLRKLASAQADLDQKEDAVVRHELVQVTKKVLPGALYYCFSGQLTLWIISALGTTSSLAQFGALSRLTMVFTLMGTLFGTLITPRFARLPNRRKTIVLFFFHSQISMFFIVGFITAITAIFRCQLLFLLGDIYKDLTEALILVVIGGGLNLIASCIWSVNSARAFLPPWYFNPSMGITGTIVFASIFDLNTLTGVLFLNIAMAITIILCTNFVFLYYILKPIKT